MNILIKIWKDPVWSKVIATLIIGAIGAAIGILKFLNLSKEWFVIALIGLIIILFLAFICFKCFFYYDESMLEADRKLFLKIKDELLPMSDMGFLKKHNFRELFTLKDLEKIYEFEHFKDDPNFEFFNPKLEQLKKNLINDIGHFKEVLMTYSVSTDSHIDDCLQVPLDWLETDPDEYNSVIREINQTADKICKNYDDIVKTGRKELKI
jgi:hypothetical protein